MNFDQTVKTENRLEKAPEKLIFITYVKIYHRQIKDFKNNCINGIVLL
jgi:hypothetical protein